MYRLTSSIEGILKKGFNPREYIIEIDGEPIQIIDIQEWLGEWAGEKVRITVRRVA